MSLIPQTHYGKPFKDLTRAYIDFEYNGTKEERLNLVCAVMAIEEPDDVWFHSYWLHKNPGAKAGLKELLRSMRETHIFGSYNVVAEAQSFIALGLDPTKFAWIDLALEWKMLINHNHKFMYGPQLIDGKKKRTRPPVSKYEQTEEQRKAADNSKPPRNLAGCVYKMLGQEIDTAHKDEMRDLIISAPEEFTPDEMRQIVEYCISDVKVLPPLRKAIFTALRESTAGRQGAITLADIAWRGETAARTALMMSTGYPVNRQKVENFSRSVGSILEDIAVDINEQFPDLKVFEWNRSRGAYSLKQKPLKEWIEKESGYAEKWMKTAGGDYSLALEAFTAHFSYSHDYPRGNLAAQIIRFLKTKQSLNGFMPAPPKKPGTKRRDTFFDAYGSDGRARAWLNPYGSQSSRFQPSATGFIPLKSAWMRSLIEPPPGFLICGIDYSSEEFLLSALLSGDEKMYQSYASGDPYLAFLKYLSVVPQDATKKSHSFERDRAKSTILGISYLMAKFSLAAKITADTGVHHTPEDAEKLINQFFEVYSDYSAFIEKTLWDYQRRGFLRLADGWVMFGDNGNFRSVSNCPIQGMGGAILRKAIQLAQKRGLRVIIPLHDALYIQFPEDQWEKVEILEQCMREAFSHYFQDDAVAFERSKAIRLEADVWGPSITEEKSFTHGVNELPVKTQRVYIDPRAKTEYERFSKYF